MQQTAEAAKAPVAAKEVEAPAAMVAVATLAAATEAAEATEAGTVQARGGERRRPPGTLMLGWRWRLQCRARSARYHLLGSPGGWLG